MGLIIVQRNVLLTSDGNAKLSDFGSARILPSQYHVTATPLSPSFYLYELLLNKLPITIANVIDYPQRSRIAQVANFLQGLRHLVPRVTIP